MFSFNRYSKKYFQRITDPHIQLMYNMALRYCGNRFDAEDIVQEAMYIAFKKRRQLKDETKCKAWLLMILRRLYLKEIRQNSNTSVAMEEFSCMELMERHAGDEQGINFEKKETAATIRRCLSELPEKYQTPTLLYYMDDMSYKEIAETMDIPQGTVMSRLARAKNLLKKKLLQQVSHKGSGKIVPFCPKSSSMKAKGGLS